MVKRKYAVALVMLSAAAIAAYPFFFRSDAARIRDRVDRLVEIACKDGPESELAAGAAARKISRLFASPCRIDAPGYGISRDYTPDDLAGSIGVVRRQHELIDLAIYDVHVTKLEANTAEVVFTAVLTSAPVSMPPVRDFHEIAVQMRKGGRNWYFSDIRIVNVLDK